MSQPIINALGQLDHANNNHWTSEGLPRIDTVRFFAGDSAISREQITAILPTFARHNGAGLAAISGGATGVAQPPASAPVVPPAPQQPTESPVVQATATDNVEDTALCEGDIALPDLTLEEQIAFHREGMAEIEAGLAEILAFKAARQAELDALIEEFEAAKPKEHTTHTILAYLESQKKIRAERFLQRQALLTSGVNMQHLQSVMGVRSPLDLALSRKNAVGMKRGI